MQYPRGDWCEHCDVTVCVLRWCWPPAAAAAVTCFIVVYCMLLALSAQPLYIYLGALNGARPEPCPSLARTPRISPVILSLFLKLKVYKMHKLAVKSESQHHYYMLVLIDFLLTFAVAGTNFCRCHYLSVTDMLLLPTGLLVLHWWRWLTVIHGLIYQLCSYQNKHTPA